MKKRTTIGLIAALTMTSCALITDGKRTPSSLINTPSEFEGKNFFEENKKFDKASLFGKHEIATFIKWVRENPIELYEALRKENPLFETGEIPGVKKLLSNEDKKGPDRSLVVTLDEDVREVLQHPEIFSVKLYQSKMNSSVGKFMLGYDKTRVNEEKSWMRSVLKKEDLPRIRETVKKLTLKSIKEGNVNGRIELVNAIARRVPLELSGEYFGFKGTDLRSMYRWSRYTQYSFFHNATNKDDYEKQAILAGEEMHEYLKGYLKEKRQSRSYENEDTVLARLLKNNVPDGELLDLYDGRVRTNIIGTLVGGVETTQAAIIQVLDFLLENPEILEGAKRAAYEDNDQLLEKYVWEALRFRPVNPFVLRFAEKDYVLGKNTSREYHVKKGQVLLVATQSAMFDESKVANPRKFKLDRGGVNDPESIYYHFGYGHHKCLGDYVAQVEVPEIIKHILKLPDLKRADGKLGKIGFHDNIGSLEKFEDKAVSPFPESLVVDFNSPVEKGKLTIADPRFAFEDYLMDYNRPFFRKCLSSYESQNTLKNMLTSIPKNIKRRKEYSDTEDLFVCRLPQEFHHCIGGMKGNNYVDMFSECKKHLTPNEIYFFKTEILGESLDLSKIPEPQLTSNNAGEPYEEDLKFYDRSDYRQTFMNPVAAKSFPIMDQNSPKEMLFYARIDLDFRKCLGPKVIIKKMSRAQAFETCMKNPDIKLDSKTVKYYRDIILHEEEQE